MVGGVGLPSSSLPVSELGEVAALGGGLPLLIGLVGVLVEVRRLGSVVVVVLGVGRSSVALVVVVMVLTVCVIKLPAAVVVGRWCGAVVCVLGVSGDGGGPRGAVGVLDRVLGRRRGCPSADDPHSSIDARCVLSLLQSAEAGRFVLLVLRATVTASPRGSVEPTGGVSPVSRMRGGV